MPQVGVSTSVGSVVFNPLPKFSWERDYKYLLGLIQKYVSYHCYSMPDLLRFQEKEDLVQDVVVKFIRLNHIEKFDETRTSIQYHIQHGVKTTLYDVLSRERNRRSERELDCPLFSNEGDGEFSLLDSQVSVNSDPLKIIELGEELVALHKSSKEWGPLRDVPFLGAVRVSMYSVYVLHLVGYTKQEIGVIFGFTSARAGQLQKQAELALQNRREGKE